MVQPMMVPLVHTLLLLAAVSATVAICRRHYQGPTPLRVGSAAVVGLGAMVSSVALTLHACQVGQPVQQWLVPGLAMTVTLALVGPAAWRRGTAVILFLAGLSLSFHYTTVVHGEVWVGVEQAPGVDGSSAEAMSEWHTWLTGLYRR